MSEYSAFANMFFSSFQCEKFAVVCKFRKHCVRKADLLDLLFLIMITFERNLKNEEQKG